MNALPVGSEGGIGVFIKRKRIGADSAGGGVTMNKVLDGMTEAEAMGHVRMMGGRGEVFEDGKHVYDCPGDKSEKCLPASCATCWTRYIRAYYAAQAAPQWREPGGNPLWVINHDTKLVCYADTADGREAEIARTNADRKVREAIRLNGGEGLYGILPCWRGGFEITRFADIYTRPAGCLSCITEDLAEEIIRRYAEELRAVMGEGK
jgi:hypothetical protein